MKRIINSTMAVLVAFALAVFPAINVKAALNTPIEPDDFGTPISVTVYVDENGCTVTESLYFYSDADATTRDQSGSGWYKNEKSYEWASGTVTTYYAQGYFVWGDGEVSVSNPSGNVNNVPSSVSISNASLTSGTGKYAGIFNNYAYVTYTCTATNAIGSSNNFSVTIRISESGNAI